MLEQALTLIRESAGTPWAVPAFLACYLAGTSLFMPAVSFHVAAGLTWGFARGVLISELGLNFAGNLQFWVGRRLGQRRVAAFLERRGLGRIEPLVHANGVWGVVAVRQLPLPFVGVNLLAGASPLRWWHFTLGSAVGGLAPIVVYSYFAAQVYSGVAGAKREALEKALLAGAAMVALAVLPRLWLHLRKRAQTSPR